MSMIVTSYFLCIDIIYFTQIIIVIKNDTKSYENYPHGMRYIIYYLSDTRFIKNIL